jgi:hypothetical protein
MAKRGDRTVVEAITKVQSVDLVADPATTRGLFEEATLGDQSVEHIPAAARQQVVEELTASRLIQLRPDLVDAIAAELTAENARLRNELDVRRAADAVEQRRAVARRILTEFELPDPASNDPWGRTIVSEAFMASLLAAPDEMAMRRLVEERANLLSAAAEFGGSGAGSGRRFAGSRGNAAGQGQPRSRDQYLVETGWRADDGDARQAALEFARAIT